MFKKVVSLIMNPIDAILKPFKIDLNSFFSYVCAILTICFAFDRILELFCVLFTGQFVNYWSPYLYAFAILIIGVGYCILVGSPYCKTIIQPVYFYIWYSIAFRIICSCMVAQWVNEICWGFLMSFSNFKYIAINLPEIVVPAVSSLTLIYIPFAIKKAIYYYIDDVVDASTDWVESFEDFKGFKLVSAKASKKTPDVYMCNAHICIDDKTAKPAVIPESKRFEAVLVEGATGTGKTATIVEPMCAMDLERKFFFREVSKKLAYNALHAGIATLRVPYSNDYLNTTFTLSYIMPKESRFDEYKNYVKDMIRYIDPETKEIYYRGLGFTLVAPDNACISRVRKVAAAYNIPVNILDPMDENSLGINPFIGSDPAKVASIISTVLKGMYEAENSSGDNVFFANVTQQAFENLAILLKLVYPRMHNGELPTLEDMLSILNNFDLAEEMTDVLKKDPVLSEDYKSLIGYFEKNFYKPPVNIHGYEIASTYGSGRKETEKFVYGAITQLDNFLRNPGIKRVLCSRDNNVDLDKALEEGQIITACTRQGDLGEIHQKAFGMFVILSLKDAVLRRPGTENTRIPHFVYIDEFPLYVNKDTEAFFTLFRKYRCGTLITIQNLSQLTKTRSLAYFKDVIITNTKTQILFGDMTNEESIYWEGELGNKKRWKYKRILTDTSTKEGADKSVANQMSAEIEYKPHYKAQKIVQLPFKTCVYRTKNESGKSIIGRGKTDFIASKYYEPHKSATYNFDIFDRADASFESPSALDNMPTNPSTNYGVAKAFKTPPTSDSINLNATSKPINTELYIDLDHDGINDFQIEDYHSSDITKKSNSNKNDSNSNNSNNSSSGAAPVSNEKSAIELNINEIDDNGDSIILDYNKK